MNALFLISTIAWHPSGRLIRTKSSVSFERALREQSGSGTADPASVCRGNMTTPLVAENRLGMDFIETVSALMNATPGVTSAGS